MQLYSLRNVYGATYTYIFFNKYMPIAVRIVGARKLHDRSFTAVETSVRHKVPFPGIFSGSLYLSFNITIFSGANIH